MPPTYRSGGPLAKPKFADVPDEPNAPLYDVRLTEPAEVEIEAEHSRLAELVSQEYADRWQDGLLAEISRLALFPTSHEVAPENDLYDGRFAECSTTGHRGGADEAGSSTESSSTLLSRQKRKSRGLYASSLFGMERNAPSANRQPYPNRASERPNMSVFCPDRNPTPGCP